MWTTRKRIDSLVKTYRRPALLSRRGNRKKEEKQKQRRKGEVTETFREKKTVRYREKGESFRSSRSRRRSLKGLKPVHAGSVVRLFTSEVGRVLIPFSFSPMFHGRLRFCLPSSAATPSSPRPTASRPSFCRSLRRSVFSGEAATSNQRNAPADTPLLTLAVAHVRGRTQPRLSISRRCVWVDEYTQTEARSI